LRERRHGLIVDRSAGQADRPPTTGGSPRSTRPAAPTGVPFGVATSLLSRRSPVEGSATVLVRPPRSEDIPSNRADRAARRAYLATMRPSVAVAAAGDGSVAGG